MSFGSLGLFRQLSALGKGADKYSDASMAKSVKRLPKDIREEFKLLKAEQDAKIAAAKEESKRAYADFLAAHRVVRPDYRAERAIVATFVTEGTAEAAGLSSDGFSLKVHGREVATRKSAGSKFVSVCPGQFGEDKTSRRAANAVLDIMGAGVRVDDRDAQAFIGAKAGRHGLVVSPTRCYTVAVTARVRKAAEAARREFWRKLPAPVEAQPRGDEPTAYEGVAPMDGLKRRRASKK